MALTMGATLTAVLVAARFVEFVAVMAVLGTALFPFYALPPQQETMAGVAAAARRILIVAAGAALLAALGWATTTFVGMSGAVSELADPASLSAFFFATSFGGVWLLRLVAAMALSGVAVLLRDRLFERNLTTALIAALAAGLLASQAWIGHPAALVGAARSFVIAAYGVHVLAAGIWIGGLVPLGLVLAFARRGGAKAVAVAQHALRRFSTVGMIAVAVLLAGGIINAFSRLGSLAAFTNSAWGQVLAFKILVFLALIAGASVNRFMLLPLLAKRPATTLAGLARSIAIEQALGLSALAAAALLGILAPPQ